MEYRVIMAVSNRGKEHNDLSDAVNAAIAKGWEPIGGVAADGWENGCNLYQAMIRRS